MNGQAIRTTGPSQRREPARIHVHPQGIDGPDLGPDAVQLRKLTDLPLGLAIPQGNLVDLRGDPIPAGRVVDAGTQLLSDAVKDRLTQLGSTTGRATRSGVPS
jgi:hypothetical protein